MTNHPLPPPDCSPRLSSIRAMPLTQAQDGDTVRIVRIRAVGNDIQEMVAAGLSIGRICPVLGHLPGGGVLLGLDDRRMAVGGLVAPDIWVRLMDREQSA